MATPSFLRPDKVWEHIGLRAGQRVVHLGCGAGYYLIPAAKQVGAMGKVVGVDIQPDMLAEAESRAQREQVTDIVHTMRANLEEINGSTLPNASNDVVLVANILHQADPTKILPEAARIVKPDGKVVVIEWSPGASPLGPPPVQRLEQTAVEEHAHAAGLTLSKTFKPSPYHYGLILTPVRNDR